MLGTSINFVRQWFDSAGIRTPDLLHGFLDSATASGVGRVEYGMGNADLGMENGE